MDKIDEIFKTPMGKENWQQAHNKWCGKNVKLKIKKCIELCDSINLYTFFIFNYYKSTLTSDSR